MLFFITLQTGRAYFTHACVRKQELIKHLTVCYQTLKNSVRGVNSKLLLQCLWKQKRTFTYSLYTILQSVAGPGGVLPKDLDGGCAARFWKPLPFFRPKYVIFPTLFILFYFRPDPKFDTLFQTRPKPYFVGVNIWEGLQIPNVYQTSVFKRRKLIKR